MFNVESAADRVARMNLQTRRDRETERRERIFNDKVRTIGVDKEALNDQMKEKEKRQDAAKQEKHAGDAALLHHRKVAALLHGRELKERRAMEKAIVDYRRQYQQPLRQRGFDPEDAQMMLPGLVGEEPDGGSRRSRQKEQLREWLLQQQRERTAERHQQKLDERHYGQGREDMDNKALQLQSIEMERRKAALVATTEYNRAMIEDKCCKQGQHDDVGTANHLRGDLTGGGAEPPEGRVPVPVWGSSGDKRAPPQSLLETIQFQKYQIEEKRTAVEREKREEEQHDRVRLDSGRAALLLERRQTKLNKQLRRQLDSTNVRLAETRRQQNPDMKRGSIDDSFFSQFNTCSR
ncbi:RIB43A-like with coiled-coils protein 2 isoform X2 [Gasterosteus aculeatus]|uniref:RIB43A-like with coiled-coils protein 2 isoform X2 n=1 Tax=Gasterosteus aculeatus aculeatus TaxID=481459 RepID=UPI001A9817D8|nr:RIB43A-like with coiled-coils protein 2 isoform X2 [Gasterosteus aculeatus aculeatus]